MGFSDSEDDVRPDGAPRPGVGLNETLGNRVPLGNILVSRLIKGG